MLAVPLESVPVPIWVDPFMNVTVPVGVPPPGLTALTLALTVMLWPKTGAVGVKLTVVAVDAWLTVIVEGDVVWPLKSVSPEYCTVIELAPSGNAVVEMLPLPLVRVADPSRVVPLKNFTVPVGVPAPGKTAATVAARATLCPKTGVVVDGINVVVVAAWPTVTGTAGEVLGAKLESPVYWAVIELVATGSVVTSSVPVPPESTTVPSGVVLVPLKNLTEPVGGGDPVGPVTVAVKATCCPKTGEAGVNVTAVWLASSSVSTTESVFVPPA